VRRGISFRLAVDTLLPETGARHPKRMWLIIGGMALVTRWAILFRKLFKSTRRTLNWRPVIYANQPLFPKTPAAGIPAASKSVKAPGHCRFVNPSVEHGGNLLPARTSPAPEKMASRAAGSMAAKSFFAAGKPIRAACHRYRVRARADGDVAHAASALRNGNWQKFAGHRTHGDMHFRPAKFPTRTA